MLLRARQVVRADLPASLVVVLIAVPLSLGIAAASGAPLVAGLIAAAVGGIVVGAMSGAPLQVSGPAAGLTVIVAGLIAEYGWATTAVMVALAGLIQIVLGLLRAGRVALGVSPAVVHGMLAGIGVVIVLGQVHVLLGGAAQSSTWANLRDLPRQLVGHHDADVLVGLVTLALLLGWPRLVRWSWLPGPLVAVAAATLLSVALPLDVERVDLPASTLDTWQWPEWPSATPSDLIVGAATLAAVASLESLMSAVAVDKLHSGPRARLNRELIAQGAGNTVSGVLGGLPITGVIVRSSANVAAGARTRAATILHGGWIAVLAATAAALLNLIPLAALAAVLLSAGVRLVNFAHLRTFGRHRELPAYLATAAGVVAVDLLTGVVGGLVVALGYGLYRLAHCDIRAVAQQPGRWRVTVTGTLLFPSVARLTSRLNAMPDGQHVDLELHLDFLDHAGFAAIDEWRTGYQQRGGHVELHDIHNNTWLGSAVRGRFSARKSLPGAPRWIAPWSTWQHTTAPAHDDALHTGVREFDRRIAPHLRPYLVDLARHGQRPQHLFITCADSRLVPNLITGSGPGDLFTVRNIGNIVPPYTRTGDQSIGAAIEYAVDILGVHTITVCGHSDCGAVKALHAATAPAGSSLARWLSHAQPADRPTDRAGDAPARADLERLSIAHIRRQVRHLHSYPSVQQATSTGRLRLAAMYFDLADASMRHVTLAGDAVAAPPGPPAPHPSEGRRVG